MGKKRLQLMVNIAFHEPYLSGCFQIRLSRNTDKLTDPLIHCLVARLVGWLADWLTH